MVSNQKSAPWLILTALLAGLLVLNLILGSVAIPLWDIIQILFGIPTENETWRNIILEFRLTKAVACLLAGAALALAGLQMQTLFRNALAGPDVLGLTSGASLLVSIVLLGPSVGLITTTPWIVAAAASCGSLIIFLVMLGMAERIHDNVSLLIVGLMVGALTTSVVSVLQYTSNAEQLQTFVVWTFGSLSNLNWTELSVLVLVLSIGTALGLYNMKSMNGWLMGERYALSVGIPVRRARTLMIISTSILTGSVTAFCGPVAFVGLAVPHLVRMVFRTSNHRVLIPAVMVGGSSLLLFCDILTAVPGEGKVLPLNAVTSLVGAPVVIWLIVRKKTISI